MPSEAFDRDSYYSGSAVNDNGKLTLCYTGNVKYADGTRTACQCLAVENSEGGFDKKTPISGLPEGYSGHVCDHKVWLHDGCLYQQPVKNKFLGHKKLSWEALLNNEIWSF